MELSIGMMDSGVGGLTVAKAVMRQLPHEPLIYFGDTARCPYGPRPPEEVRRYAWEVIHFLQEFSLKMLVIACNTVTATMLTEVRKTLPIPVIGVITPGVRAALRQTKTGRIGVIGTQGTISSGAYEQQLLRLNPNLHVASLACPSFVPLVEEGRYRAPEAEDIVRETLRPLMEEQLDTLILGCTHYPLLAPIIQKVMGEGVTLISSAEETAKEVDSYLRTYRLLHPSTLGPAPRQIYVSGDPEQFRRIASDWFGREFPVTGIQWPQVG